jgi:multisubunit Na+/H+ antiporter MnhG subunit
VTVADLFTAAALLTGSALALLAAVGLQLLTAPVRAHLVGRAAYRAGTELGPVTVDELADAPPGEET